MNYSGIRRHFARSSIPHRGEKQFEYVIGRARTVDHYEFVFRAVIVEDRSGLLIVDVEPVTNRLRLVVRALNQFTATIIADAFLFWR